MVVVPGEEDFYKIEDGLHKAVSLRGTKRLSEIVRPAVFVEAEGGPDDATGNPYSW